MYNLMIVLGTKQLKVYALPVENVAKSQINILIRSFKEYKVIKNFVELELNIKCTHSNGGQLAMIKSADVFSHTLTLRKDTSDSTNYHNVLIIGHNNINKMSKTEIDVLIARMQQTAMEDYNNSIKPLNT